MHIVINKKFLTFNNYKAKCALGKRGIGFKREEGDLITPKGVFKIKYILYRKDRLKKIQSKLRKITIKKNMGWCDDPKSRDYNKLIKLPSKYTYEKLYKKENIYDIILVLNFNMSPILKKKGSAVFIHVARKNFAKTEGCIAIKKTYLLKIIKEIKTSTKVKIENRK
jgi:L,D-peptidoglycan transpeptidase YkuD (ErfK/YbiS/YcfS/YnhG family)